MRPHNLNVPALSYPNYPPEHAWPTFWTSVQNLWKSVQNLRYLYKYVQWTSEIRTMTNLDFRQKFVQLVQMWSIRTAPMHWSRSDSGFYSSKIGQDPNSECAAKCWVSHVKICQWICYLVDIARTGENFAALDTSFDKKTMLEKNWKIKKLTTNGSRTWSCFVIYVKLECKILFYYIKWLMLQTALRSPIRIVLRCCLKYVMDICI